MKKSLLTFSLLLASVAMHASNNSAFNMNHNKCIKKSKSNSYDNSHRYVNHRGFSVIMNDKFTSASLAAAQRSNSSSPTHSHDGSASPTRFIPGLAPQTLTKTHGSAKSLK